MPLEEKVLVVPTELFHKVGHFQGFCKEAERYLPVLLDKKFMEFRVRQEVEQQPEWKQLIPYILFRWTDETGTVRIFRYTRGKGMGEGRLHLKHSVGVGGHISEDDALECKTQAGETFSAESLYHRGMMREREEEVDIQTTILNEKIVGLINDDLTEVGKVHLGVVHMVDVAEPKVFSREKDIIASGFVPVKDMLENTEGFETWSALTLEALFGKN
ncbi:MAG: phosphoesterase [Planctomycetia bacterium]|nr:phosphoesterase [Planctomycetia bacterium]